MSDEFYEEEKGKNIFVRTIFLSAIFLGFITALFTNYKKETLICSKSNNNCYIQKINLLNIKSKKKLLNYSDIKYVTYMPKSVKGNLYAKGYKYYYLIFMTKKNENIRIFNADYYEIEKIKSDVEKLKKIMKNNDYFEYEID
ncbi:hypothetical protein J6G99_07585 [bacterium]|nr:hypothetical protein [bacterium]